MGGSSRSSNTTQNFDQRQNTELGVQGGTGINNRDGTVTVNNLDGGAISGAFGFGKDVLNLANQFNQQTNELQAKALKTVENNSERLTSALVSNKNDQSGDVLKLSVIAASVIAGLHMMRGGR